MLTFLKLVALLIIVSFKVTGCTQLLCAFNKRTSAEEFLTAFCTMCCFHTIRCAINIITSRKLLRINILCIESITCRRRIFKICAYNVKFLYIVKQFFQDKLSSMINNCISESNTFCVHTKYTVLDYAICIWCSEPQFK